MFWVDKEAPGGTRERSGPEGEMKSQEDSQGL